MRKVELHCLMVGAEFGDYPGLAKVLRQFDAHTYFNHISNNSVELKQALKRLQGASLVFVPETLFSTESNQKPSHSNAKDALRAFTDLIWQYASDAIVVVLDRKPSKDTFATYLNDVQISWLHYSEASFDDGYNNDDSLNKDSHDNQATRLQLQFLAQTALLKYDFRCCKRLLGISEKRTEWLVDSSTIPVAYISHNLHLHANNAYLSLFGIDSINALRSMSVKEFISKQEHAAFDDFIRSQTKQKQQSQSLFLQMQKKDSAQFRANIRVIPSVFRGKRCQQLWVNALAIQKKPQTEMEKLWGISAMNQNENIKENEDKNIPKDFSIKDLVGEEESPFKTISPSLILKGILARKETQIVTHALLNLNKSKTHNKQQLNQQGNQHFLASLKVPYAQRYAVDDLLTKAPYDEIKAQRSLFWDKVKLTRIFQIINKRNTKNIRLLVRLSEATINDKNQILWLQKCIVKLGVKSSMIIFMLPSRLGESSQKASVKFINMFKSYGCQFALDDFFVNSQSLSLLKHTKPRALRFYLPWLQEIEGNQEREFALSRLIRQMESRNIRIIVPCGFSQEMNRLFVLSGASFCQEKRKNSA